MPWYAWHRGTLVPSKFVFDAQKVVPSALAHDPKLTKHSPGLHGSTSQPTVTVVAVVVTVVLVVVVLVVVVVIVVVVAVVDVVVHAGRSISQMYS